MAVTGAGRGIGRAVALAAAAEGARVVVNDYGVSVEGAEPVSEVAAAVVKEIEAAGGEAVAVADDVSTMEAGQRIVDTAVSAYGRLDGVVCVAGILRERMLFNMTEDEWDPVVATHLKGTFTVFRAASALMRRQRSGTLIGFTSGNHQGSVAVQVRGRRRPSGRRTAPRPRRTGSTPPSTCSCSPGPTPSTAARTRCSARSSPSACSDCRRNRRAEEDPKGTQGAQGLEGRRPRPVGGCHAWSGVRREAAEVVDDLGVRDPGPGEVAVAVAAAGLCHSDLSVVDGTIPFPAPVVLGHEGAGVVEAVGAGVTHVRPGDHVALSTLANCGTCADCDRGRPTMCRRAIGRPGRPFSRDGRPVHQFASNSAFAERTVVKAVQAVRIPPDIPLTSAALIGCGVLTGVGAVLNRARVERGDTVVVIGTGGIGLNVLQGARLAGAHRIVAVDTNPAKEAVARQFGATDFLTSTAGVRDLLPTGADHAFECVGRVELVRQAVDLLDRHGQAVLLGMPAPDAEATFAPASLFLDKSILGCRYGSSRPQHDIALYAALYQEGRLLLDELVTQTYPVEEFDRTEAGKVARAVLTF